MWRMILEGRSRWRRWLGLGRPLFEEMKGGGGGGGGRFLCGGMFVGGEDEVRDWNKYAFAGDKCWKTDENC